MLKIPREIHNSLFEHAASESPVEACGYLAGRDDRVLKHYRMKNTDNSSEHYSLDPAEQFSVIKETRSEQLEILAVYHSHPATPARPSEEDIKLAYDPDISYVIISLLENKIKSFKIHNKTAEAEELEVV